MNQGTLDFAEWQVEEDQKNGLHIQGLMKFVKQTRPVAITAHFQKYAKFSWGNLLSGQDIDRMKTYCRREKTRVRPGNMYGEDELTHQKQNNASKDNIIRGLVDKIRGDGKIKARSSWFVQRGSKKMWDSALEQYNAEESAFRHHRLYENAKSVVWKPWQQFVANQLKEPINSRRILVILDETGNAGKTFFYSKWMHLNDETVCFLTNGNARDLMYILSKKPLCDTILVNLTRSEDGSVNYKALEQAKDGVFCSTKYEGQEKNIGPTRMVVFTNNPLNWNALSKDRWQILTIQGWQHDFKVESYEEYKHSGGKDSRV